MLGRQMSIANTNHIVVVPFFTDSTYSSTGIFSTNWLDLMEQIITGVRNAQGSEPPAAVPGGRVPNVPVTEVNPLVLDSPTQKKGAPSAVRTSSNQLTNVVLSCFSRGRELMGRVQKASGLQSFLREAWDFDGVGGAPAAGCRVMTYDQQSTTIRRPDTFHVPPERWIPYHKRLISAHDNHGNIPGMLAFHAASISRVGK